MAKTYLFKKIFRRLINDFYDIEWLPIQLFYIFSSKKYVKSKVLNLLNIQALRIKIADTRLEKKRCVRAMSADELNWINQLKNDGILIVPNALSQEDVIQINKTLELKTSNNQTSKHLINHKELADTGTTFDHIPLTDLGGGIIDSCAGKLVEIENTVELYLAKKVKSSWYVKIVKDNSSGGTAAGDTFCHSDTFHNTLKAWIYLDTIPANGPSLKYFIGSHLMQPNVLDLHLARARADTSRSPRIDSSVISDLGFEKFDEKIVAGTLILADTRGFHYRNHSPNWTKKRATIYASFRPSPFWG